MELPLQAMEQLGYLFLNNKVHEKSKTDEIVKEVIEMHDKYIDSDAYFEAYTYEMEQALIEQKRERAKEEGLKKGEAIGELKGKRNTLIMLLNQKLGTVSKEIIDKINSANNQQLHEISKNIFTINSEEDVMNVLVKIEDRNDK